MGVAVPLKFCGRASSASARVAYPRRSMSSRSTWIKGDGPRVTPWINVPVTTTSLAKGGAGGTAFRGAAASPGAGSPCWTSPGALARGWGRRGRRRRGPEDKRLRTCLHHLNSGALQEPAQRRLRRQPRLQACRATPRHEACVEHQLQSALAGELNQGGAELAAGDVETDRRGRRGRGDDAHRRSQGCRERHHGRPAPAGRALGWLQVHRCPPPRASPESNGRGERVGRDERDPGSPWATFKV
jgi:hypothetical protein